MYELIKLSENDYYFDCPSKIGLVKINENQAVLIDSGNDKDAAKKILKKLDEMNLQLKAVYNTHTHADHAGGNKHLKEKTNCEIYAYGSEVFYTEYPIFLPTDIYGAYPIEEIQNKFLVAKASFAMPLKKENLPEGFEIIELFGHTNNMIGIKTADGNIFIGDTVASAATLEKYGIVFAFDIENYILSIEKLKTLSAVNFIPSHAGVCSDIVSLANKNLEAVAETEKRILKFLQTPMIFEDLLKEIFDSYSLSLSAQQYALVGSTVRSFLSMLKKQNKANYYFENNKMLWKAE